MNKLLELRKEKDVRQIDIANMLKVSKQCYSNYEKGLREPDFATLQKLADYFEVSVDYILGRGNRTATAPHPDIKPIRLKKFRMLGEIACGKPIFAEEDHETYIDASADIKADFCVKAKGESMIGARIKNGDIVFIHAQEIVNNGEIAAVIIDNDVTLKRWYYYPDKQKLVLSPENPAYEPFVYVGEELSTIRCLGKAVAFMSNL